MSTDGIPVDSATGNIANPQPVKLNKSQGAETVIYNRSRTYQHYMTNTLSVPTVTDRPNFFGSNLFRESCEGLSVIPYYNLGIACTLRDFFTMHAYYDRVRVLELGYEVKKITFLQESITSRASTSIVENVFESRPYIIHCQDSEYELDDWVGHSGQASRLLANATIGDELAAFPCFTKMNTNNLPNSNVSYPWPIDQASGTLPGVSHYFGDRGFKQQPLTVTDMFNCHIVGEGDTFGYTWVNPTPKWHMMSSYKFRISGASATSAFVQPGYYPRNRDEATREAYMKRVISDNTDNTAMNGTSATRLEQIRGVTGTGENLREPPLEYIKISSLMGPTGLIKLVCALLVEYKIKLELRVALHLVDDGFNVAGTQGVGILDASTNIGADQAMASRKRNWGSADIFVAPSADDLRNQDIRTAFASRRFSPDDIRAPHNKRSCVPNAGNEDYEIVE